MSPKRPNGGLVFLAFAQCRSAAASAVGAQTGAGCVAGRRARIRRGKLAAAIDLQGDAAQGHAIQQRAEELGGGEGVGVGSHLQDILRGDDIAGAEVLQDQAARRSEVLGVERDQIAGSLGYLRDARRRPGRVLLSGLKSRRN